MNIIILVSNIIQYNILFIDCCIIPYFGNHLTRAAHFMYYLHDILNL